MSGEYGASLGPGGAAQALRAHPKLKGSRGLLEHDRGLLEGDHQRFGRLILQQGANKCGPDRHRGPSPAPVVHLAGRDAGEPREGGLADAGAGQEGREFGA